MTLLEQANKMIAEVDADVNFQQQRIKESDTMKRDTLSKLRVRRSETLTNAATITRRMTRGQAAKALADMSSSRKRQRIPSALNRGSRSSPIDSDSEDQLVQSPDGGGNPDPLTFKSKLHHGLWTFVCSRNVIREHFLLSTKVKNLGIIENLEDMGLAKTSLSVPTYVLKVVLEFYANLCQDISVVTSPNAFKNFVRGVTIDFSPSIINEFLEVKQHVGPSMVGALDLVASEITGGLYSGWPDNGGIKASSLTYRYSILHKVAIRNWAPSTHNSQVHKDLAVLLYQIGTNGSLDFGLHVFNHVINHAESQAVQKPIGFLSLIFGII